MAVDRKVGLMEMAVAFVEDGAEKVAYTVAAMAVRLLDAAIEEALRVAHSEEAATALEAELGV